MYGCFSILNDGVRHSVFAYNSLRIQRQDRRIQCGTKQASLWEKATTVSGERRFPIFIVNDKAWRHCPVPSIKKVTSVKMHIWKVGKSKEDGHAISYTFSLQLLFWCHHQPSTQACASLGKDFISICQEIQKSFNFKSCRYKVKTGANTINAASIKSLMHCATAYTNSLAKHKYYRCHRVQEWQWKKTVTWRGTVKKILI